MAIRNNGSRTGGVAVDFELSSAPRWQEALRRRAVIAHAVQMKQAAWDFLRIALCTVACAAPFTTNASESSERISETLAAVERIAHFPAGRSLTRPYVRECYVAVHALLNFQAGADDAEPLRILARTLEPVCEQGLSSKLEAFGLLHLLDEAGFAVDSKRHTKKDKQPSAEAPLLDADRQNALRSAVGRCWNLGTTSAESLQVTVTVFVRMNPDGTPDAGSMRLVAYEGGSEAAAKRVYDAARRAIIRCGQQGYALDPARYDQWRELEIRFNTEWMRMH